MTTTTHQKRHAYIAFGIIGLVFSAGYLAASFQLPLGRLDRPGAGVFPIVVGVIMAGASFATLWEGLQMGEAEPIDFPSGVNRRRLFILVALLFGYVLVLPWLGQIATGFVFSALLMRILSELSWLRIAVYSLALSVSIDFVFARLLAVPLPAGIFGY
ncbi:tripartite tricarboxylate transporter TctB family protein [Pseudochelatococcus sp. B33]